jgi:hypothetical protein
VRGPTAGPERSGRRFGVVRLHGEQDQLEVAAGGGRIGDRLDRMEEGRAATAPDRETALLEGAQVIASGDERDRVAKPGERRAVVPAHGAGAHHEDAHKRRYRAPSPASAGD